MSEICAVCGTELEEGEKGICEGCEANWQYCERCGYLCKITDTRCPACNLNFEMERSEHLFLKRFTDFQLP